MPKGGWYAPRDGLTQRIDCAILIHCTECYQRAKGLGVLPYSEWLDELRSQESYHARDH